MLYGSKIEGFMWIKARIGCVDVIAEIDLFASERWNGLLVAVDTGSEIELMFNSVDINGEVIGVAVSVEITAEPVNSSNHFTANRVIDDRRSTSVIRHKCGSIYFDQHAPNDECAANVKCINFRVR